jgi:hypothetical protein
VFATDGRGLITTFKELRTIGIELNLSDDAMNMLEQARDEELEEQRRTEAENGRG